MNIAQIALICACVSLSSCKDAQIMTPDQLAQSDQLENEIQGIKSQKDALLLKSQQDAKANDAIALAQDKLDMAKLVTQFQNDAAAQDKLRTDAINQKVGPVGELVGTVFPGWGWLAMLAPLLFKRSRDHALDGMKSLVQLDPTNFVQSLLKMTGLLHTSADDKAAPEAIASISKPSEASVVPAIVA